MKYLAISKTPYYIAYSVFEDKVLVDYGKIKLNGNCDLKRLVEWESAVNEIIKKHSPTFLLTHLLEIETLLKKDIEKVVEIRTILKLLSEKNNIIYMEFKTSGWEKKIIGRSTNFRKIQFINRSYGTKIDDVEIANAIILCEGVAHKKLQVAK